MAMELQNWEGKKSGNGVAENWRERERERERESAWINLKKKIWILILKSTHISMCQ